MLKFILSIYLIKTEQLLTIFRSLIHVKRGAFVTWKEIFFPSIYLIINILITITIFIEYKFKYGILENKEELIRYQFCNMTIYDNIDLFLVMFLSLVCCIQSFLARKLPANFNETYYIFLGMFTTNILLLLSFPLAASFKRDGHRIFVNSFIVYSVNMSLVTIAYSYKVFIMLFQKEKNTKQAFLEMRKQYIDNMFQQKKHDREASASL